MKSICLWVAILTLSLGVTLAIEDRQTPLSLARMQEILYDLQDEVKMDPLPIGFIYVQFPKEKAPADIWPSMTWSEVTSAYEGLFFRAAGGGATPFGSIQEENVPVIDKVEGEGCFVNPDGTCHYGEVYTKPERLVDIPKAAGGWSGWMASNWKFNQNAPYAMNLNRFHSSGGTHREMVVKPV